MSKIKDFFKNPYFLAIMALLGVCIGILQFLFPLISKESDLRISLLSSVQIIEIANNIDKTNLSFFYKDQKVESLSYLKIRIKNTGTTPFLRQDFREDITLELPTDSKIIAFSSKPILANLSKSNEYTLKIEIDLLNPEELIDLELLIENRGSLISFDEIKVSGRIVGIFKLEIEDGQKNPLLSKEEARIQSIAVLKKAREYVFESLALIVFMGLFLWVLSLGDTKKEQSLWKKIIYWSLITIFLGLVAIAIIFTIGKILYELSIAIFRYFSFN
ncbi:MAG: hypothetical protein Q8P35_00275 [Candidatus Yanofskybacteria bacterium]|nr:hypothetical protein [Candidatus Yanofskybacteria bacterium]